RWVTCVAPPILWTDVHDYRFRLFSLDLKGGDERVFGVHDDSVRFSIRLQPDGKLHRHASSVQSSGPDDCPLSDAVLLVAHVGPWCVCALIFKFRDFPRQAFQDTLAQDGIGTKWHV